METVKAMSHEQRAMSPRWFFFCFSLLVAHCCPCWSDAPSDLFKAANGFYAAGKFSDAALKYQEAADGGLRHWMLEYDLGNAYFRTGQIGKAVLHYERAFRMNSGQADVLYNLNLATTKAGEPEMPAGALPAFGWRLFYSLSVNSLTLLCSFLFIFFCAIGGAALLGRSYVRSDLVWALGLLLAALAGWLGARMDQLETPEGVVTASVAEVRSGPNLTYPANFTVPEGHRVLILKEQEPIQGWLEIGVADQGLKGWVPTSSVETI